jgi:hypothetical protein
MVGAMTDFDPANGRFPASISTGYGDEAIQPHHGHRIASWSLSLGRPLSAEPVGSQ